ncbi:MAG: hypothetical protein AB2696_08090 [Candidatus Thiodiazotropha sp.]|nr:hypothetical protein [Candidatus Thiodiazotropha sp. (ex Lucina pensylvanica)]
MMGSDIDFMAGVGFRHVIEDGLVVLSKGDMDSARRKYVVDDLTNLLSEAIRGLELVNRNALFVNSDQRNAVDTFSLLDQYLGHGYDPSWGNQLHIAEEAFDKLQKNEEPSDEARTAAIQLFEELLTKIKRQGWTGILEQPASHKIFE